MWWEQAIIGSSIGPYGSMWNEVPFADPLQFGFFFLVISFWLLCGSKNFSWGEFFKDACRDNWVYESNHRVWSIILLAHHPRYSSVKPNSHCCCPANIARPFFMISWFYVLVFILNLYVYSAFRSWIWKR